MCITVWTLNIPNQSKEKDKRVLLCVIMCNITLTKLDVKISTLKHFNSILIKQVYSFVSPHYSISLARDHVPQLLEHEWSAIPADCS